MQLDVAAGWRQRPLACIQCLVQGQACFFLWLAQLLHEALLDQARLLAVQLWVVLKVHLEHIPLLQIQRQLLGPAIINAFEAMILCWQTKVGQPAYVCTPLTHGSVPWWCGQ